MQLFWLWAWITGYCMRKRILLLALIRKTYALLALLVCFVGLLSWTHDLAATITDLAATVTSLALSIAHLAACFCSLSIFVIPL